MFHWYVVKTGGLMLFYDAQDPEYAEYKAVSKAVQFAVSAASYTNGILLTSASLSTVIFTVGLADALRDPGKRVRFGLRERTLVILIFFYKFVVYAVQLAATEASWNPNELMFMDRPRNILWFVYVLLFVRLATSILQCFGVHHALMVLGAMATVIITNTAGDSNHVCNYCQLTSSTAWSSDVTNVLNFLFYGSSSLVARSTLPTKDPFTVVSEIPPSRLQHWLSGYVYTSPKSTVRILEPKYVAFYPVYLIGYFYGDRIVASSRRFANELGGTGSAYRPVLVCVVSAYGVFCLYDMCMLSWLSQGTPRLHTPNVADIPELSGAPWIWSSSAGTGLANWGPPCARPFYFFLQWIAEYTVAYLLLTVCVALPWRAARCGNAALGSFFFLFIWPTSQYVWLAWIVSKLGHALGPDNVVTGLVQVVLLISWPFAYVYLVGPVLTAVVVAEPRIVRWVGRFCLGPPSALREARDAMGRLPATTRAWWSNYIHEIYRDAAHLADFGRTMWRHHFPRLLPRGAPGVPSYGATSEEAPGVNRGGISGVNLV